MEGLRRITTVYDASEDRIRLSGLVSSEQTVVMWLTQRLLNRLVPHLCESLEKKTVEGSGKGVEQPLRAYVEQAFAQEKARVALTPQKPVVAPTDAPHWRVESVDIRRGAAGVRMVFNGRVEGERAIVDLPTSPLRQWLGIVFDQYRKAGWPTQVWPTWMLETAAPPVKASAISLH